ncbi:sugar O-acetyltransferase [Ruminococcus flavefaciens]|uniref:sugar O-acetyltransferase n=1 Tax=Ruminococcus flavefaciens TaxID=1265 RepID=UPI0026F25AAB|nr:sugar O-acetyltransferase [Ruminococcus flavefaciens]
MTTQEFISFMNSGRQVTAECGVHQTMHKLSQDAIKITMEINSRYHTPDEINELMSQLIGSPVEVGLFPPFYTDCGKNIHLGKGVFINAGCKFQDQGGIYIGDGALIGHNTVLATLNHGLLPEERHDLIPKPIHIGKNVWIGSNSTILSGVTIGDNAVIGAGSVVTKDIPGNMIAVGSPAKVIRSIYDE